MSLSTDLSTGSGVSPERPPSALDIALEMARVGYWLAPVTLRRKPDGDKDPDYHELSWNKVSTTDPEIIRDWSVQFPDCSFLVDCGRSGIVVVDLDVKTGRDGRAAWSGRGGAQGGVVVDTISGGEHHYFAADPARPLSNTSDRSTGIDTRAGVGHVYAPGARFVDEEGGYVARGPLWTPGDLPKAPELLYVSRKAESPNAGAPLGDRRFTRDQARDYVTQYAIEPLKAAREGERNTTLNNSAVVLGHFVGEFAEHADVALTLRKLAHKVGLDGREVEATIASGLNKGMAEPYTLVEVDIADVSAIDEPSERERRVAERIEWMEVDREARAEIARRARPTHLSIEDGLIDDLDTIEPPVMLMESLIPEGSIGFLAGKSGAYKSFLAVSWACCIATGRPWLGEDRFAVRRPLKVLYVAAEGPSGAAGRMRAWEASVHGTSRRGRAILHKRPIHLNDEHQAAELAEVIERHGFEFLVIDTYHRSAPGTEENSSTDFGRVYEAVAQLRDRFGIGVLFVDHTGNAKSGNPRGTSAKRDDSDYVLSVSYPGEEATPAAQRELWVTKLKDEGSIGRWPLRLVPVEGEHFPVVEIGTISKVDPVVLDHGWLGIAQASTPDRVRAIDGRPGEAAVDIWRVLAYNGGERGLTQAEIKRVLQQTAKVTAYKVPSEGAFNRAFTAMSDEKAVRRGETDSRWLAADPSKPGKIIWSKDLTP